MIFFFISSCIISALIYFLVKQLFSPLRHLPNPGAWPLVNQIPLFLTNTDQVDIIENFCQKYKKDGAFRMTRNVFEGEAVYLTNAEDYKMILSKPDTFYRFNEFFRHYLPLTGDGLLTATGKQHQFQKKLLMKSFSSLHLKHYIPAFNKHSAVLVKILHDLVKSEKAGRNVQVQHYFEMFAFDVIGQIAFGYNFEAQISKQSKFVSTIFNHMDAIANLKTRLLLDLLPFLWLLPFGPGAKLKKADKEAREVMDKLLQSRKSRLIEKSLSDEEENDLLSLMIKAKDDETKKGMTDQIMRDNLYTILITAVDTSALTLAWCFLMFAKYPEHQHKARQEILTNLKHSEITNEDMAAIPFTQAFLKEVLRYNVVAPVNARIAQKDVKVRGHLYPKGTFFMLPMSYYNKEKFKNGSKFQPERFMELSDDSSSTNELYSFSYGPYSCIGKNFAMLEITIAIIHLLRNFEFSVEPKFENYMRRTVATVMTDPPITIKIKSLH